MTWPDGFVAYPTQTAASLARLAALVSGAVVVAPVPFTDDMYTPALSPLVSISTENVIGNEGGYAEHLPATEGLQVISMQARDEAAIAIRLLREFETDVGAYEVDSYIKNIESTLTRIPVRPNASQAVAFVRALRMARARLVSETSSIDRWGRAVRAIEPEAEVGYRVPERFVRREAPQEEPPLLIDERENEIERAIEAFTSVTPDADSTASQS